MSWISVNAESFFPPSNQSISKSVGFGLDFFIECIPKARSWGKKNGEGVSFEVFFELSNEATKKSFRQFESNCINKYQIHIKFGSIHWTERIRICPAEHVVMVFNFKVYTITIFIAPLDLLTSLHLLLFPALSSFSLSFLLSSSLSLSLSISAPFFHYRFTL